MANSVREAEADGVVVPKTLQEYCQKSKPQSTSSFDMADDLFDEDDDYFPESSDNEATDSEVSDASAIEEDSGTCTA